jgi:hypothetical protein
MLCPRRAVDEIPLSQMTFLAFNQKQAFACDNKEVLLSALTVIERRKRSGSPSESVASALHACVWARIALVAAGRADGDRWSDWVFTGAA